VATGVVCAHCGAMMGPVDFASRLVVKLAELRRFGLTGPDEVLRPPSPPPSRTRDH
jgi:hypothetical protein